MTTAEQNEALEGVDGWTSSEIHTQTERAKTTEEQIKLYTQWADTYDAEMDANGLSSYKSVTAKVLEFWASDSFNFKPDPGEKTLRVLEAGCGTGLLGRHLKAATNIGLHLSGLDLCPELLKQAAKKDCYDRLTAGNLLMELPYPEEHFHHIVSTGVFMPGHVGPEAIKFIFPRLRGGGLFITTVREAMYREHETAFLKVIEESNGQLLEAEIMPYYGEIDANVLVVRKNV